MTTGEDQAIAGTVAEVRRYPVKSMLGETLTSVDVTERGLVGDRAYALAGCDDGKIVSVKNPKKWPAMFECLASYATGPGSNGDLAPARITLPDGTVVLTDSADAERVLSRAMSWDVTLKTVAGLNGNGARSTSEGYWPDIEGLPEPDSFTDFQLAQGTFFDSGVLHLVSTSTLKRLRELHPSGRFEPARFRPNLVLDTNGSAPGFLEEGWIGRTVEIGDEVQLRITKACSRCVMTTLPQQHLPRDLDILRTAVKHNQAHVGVYAAVIQSGTIRRGDRIRLR